MEFADRKPFAECSGFLSELAKRTPGGGTDLACMMGREKTIERIRAAVAKLGG